MFVLTEADNQAGVQVNSAGDSVALVPAGSDDLRWPTRDGPTRDGRINPRHVTAEFGELVLGVGPGGSPPGQITLPPPRWWLPSPRGRGFGQPVDLSVGRSRNA